MFSNSRHYFRKSDRQVESYLAAMSPLSTLRNEKRLIRLSVATGRKLFVCHQFPDACFGQTITDSRDLPRASTERGSSAHRQFFSIVLKPGNSPRTNTRKP